MKKPPKSPELLAAVDLGSNSFHLVVARVNDGVLQVVDRLREAVRMAAGLDDRGRLSAEVRDRALACLRRFGERLRDMPAEAVRVVGTNTMRKAKNGTEFLREAEAAVGHRIEIISGIEEARLIYLGVSHSLASTSGPRLVVDIGGGSTEIIVGEGYEPHSLESLHIGAVALTCNYFANGTVTRKAWRKAELAAKLELEPVQETFRRLRWDAAVGASGSIRAIRDVVIKAGWSGAGITPLSLKKLAEYIVKTGDIQKLQFEGLNADRAEILPAGVVILNAIFDVLGIENMDVAEGALREGLLYDLLGRFQDDDIRARSVHGLAGRYHVDKNQAQRVATTALRCFDAVVDHWDLDEESRRLLAWAAALHEIGLAISHSQYHKHGAYVAQHADMPGFSRQDQRGLALLVRVHRRKFAVAEFQFLPAPLAARLQRLSIVLRLAVLLHRNRSETALPELMFKPGKNSLDIVFPDAWLENSPLTRADLEQEARYLRAADFTLSWEEA